MEFVTDHVCEESIALPLPCNHCIIVTSSWAAPHNFVQLTVLFLLFTKQKPTCVTWSLSAAARDLSHVIWGQQGKTGTNVMWSSKQPVYTVHRQTTVIISLSLKKKTHYIIFIYFNVSQKMKIECIYKILLISSAVFKGSYPPLDTRTSYDIS